MSFQRLNIQTHPELATLIASFVLSWTHHATERANTKDIPLYLHLDVKKGQVVEAELEGKSVTKLVVRFSLTTQKDAVLVVRPSKNGEAVVVTCWTNHKNDTHKTLNKDRINV